MKSLAFSFGVRGAEVQRPAQGLWWEWDPEPRTWGTLEYPHTLLKHTMSASLHGARALVGALTRSGSEHVLVYWEWVGNVVHYTAFMSETPTTRRYSRPPFWANGLAPVRPRAYRLLDPDT